MKKIILVVVLCSVPVVVNGWEFPKNPDRFPSVGLALSGQSLSGDQSSPSNPSVGSQGYETSIAMLAIDTRLPLSNSFTLDLALGSVSSDASADETIHLNSAKADATGGYFRIGARWYFNR